MDTIVLASSSPRRKELLHSVTDDFVVQNPVCEELETGDPTFVAMENAMRKGRAVNAPFVVACDTLVTQNGVIYGKPHDEQDALDMLRALNGKTHEVVSGCYVRFHEEETTFFDVSHVTFKTFSDDELLYYIKHFSPLDKAGSYGIQDDFLVEKYEGSLDNIIGLPTEKLREILRKYVQVKEKRHH